jgi:hypothetical protein
MENNEAETVELGNVRINELNEMMVDIQQIKNKLNVIDGYIGLRIEIIIIAEVFIIFLIVLMLNTQGCQK